MKTTPLFTNGLKSFSTCGFAELLGWNTKVALSWWGLSVVHTITPTAQRGTHIKIIWLLLSWYFPYFPPRMANTWLSYSLQDYPIRLSCGLGCFKIEFVPIIGFVIVNIKLVQYLQTKKSSCVGKANGSCIYYMNFDMERNADSLEGSWLRNKIKTSMAKLPKHSFFFSSGLFC